MFSRMFFSLLLVGLLAASTEASLTAAPEPECAEGMVLDTCGAPCSEPSCSNPQPIACGAPCQNIPQCICDRKNGYIRDENGLCIQEKQCPPQCAEGMVLDTCGAPCPEPSCSSPEPIFCRAACLNIPICICDRNNGYVRDENGDCIQVEQCPPSCGENEVFSNCDSICRRTCENKDLNLACKAPCFPGCVCDEARGFIRDRNENGQCILESQCPPVCGENQIFRTCGSACPGTCDNQPVICTLQCVAGCFCETGFVRLVEDGPCVPPEECPSASCGENESFKSCGSACPKTCGNKDEQQFCIAVCVEGCFCDDGFLRDKNGRCVLESECPSTTSDECNKEGELERGCACGETTCTDIPGPLILCPRDCLSTVCLCDNANGYVRGPNGDCVLLRDCPQARDCEAEEVYVIGSPCQDSFCPNNVPSSGQLDIIDCFCKDGFIRENGRCREIKKDECPPCNIFSCLVNPCEVSKCDQFPSAQCVPNFCGGCDATFFDFNQCREVNCDETPQCKVNEVFNECGTACPETCDSTPFICTKQCVIGCFCEDGFVRESIGGPCIRRTECPSAGCGANEVFASCGTACPKTCDNRNELIPCTKNCVVGCFCEEGYVRESVDGPCIPESDCTSQCKANEIYDQCGTACPETCDDKPLFCTEQCVIGCFCEEGFVREAIGGPCISRTDCPADNPDDDDDADGDAGKECDGEGELPEGCSCGETTCAENIGPRVRCASDCPTKVCLCDNVNGYVRGPDGGCVHLNDCPQAAQCTEKEVYQIAVPNSDLVCPSFTPLSTVFGGPEDVGCFCTEGYLRHDGRCIEPGECPSCTVANCFADPCLSATCPDFPDAQCVSNFCNSCNAIFYVNDNKGLREVQCGVKLHH